MKKINLITILLVIVAILFTGCSDLGKSQERLDNEAKMLKLAENMGQNKEEVLTRIENMSDEELNEVASMINDNGKIDTSKIFENVKESQKEENDKLMKYANLNEINTECDIIESSTHIKEGLKISLAGKGKVPDSEDVSMNNLNGNIQIKIYNVVKDTTNSYYENYKKGDLIKTIEGNINDLMKIEESSSFLGINYDYTLKLELDDLDLTKLTESEIDIDDEYEYNYLKYPLWFDITYKENNKEYREVIEYNKYDGCNLFEKIDTDRLKIEFAKKSTLEYLELWNYDSYYQFSNNEKERLALTGGNLYEAEKKYLNSQESLQDLITHLKNKCRYVYSNEALKTSCNVEIIQNIINYQYSSELMDFSITSEKLEDEKLILGVSYIALINNSEVQRDREFILIKNDENNWLINDLIMEDEKLLSELYLNQSNSTNSLVNLFKFNEGFKIFEYE